MAAEHHRAKRVDGQHPRRDADVGDGVEQAGVDGPLHVSGGVFSHLVDESVDGGTGIGEAMREVAEDLGLAGLPQRGQHVGYGAADGVVLSVADEGGDVVVAAQEHSLHRPEVVPDQPDGDICSSRDGSGRGFMALRDECDGGVPKTRPAG